MAKSEKIFFMGHKNSCMNHMAADGLDINVARASVAVLENCSFSTKRVNRSLNTQTFCLLSIWSRKGSGRIDDDDDDNDDDDDDDDGDYSDDDTNETWMMNMMMIYI